MSLILLKWSSKWVKSYSSEEKDISNILYQIWKTILSQFLFEQEEMFSMTIFHFFNSVDHWIFLFWWSKRKKNIIPTFRIITLISFFGLSIIWQSFSTCFYNDCNLSPFFSKSKLRLVKMLQSGSLVNMMWASERQLKMKQQPFWTWKSGSNFSKLTPDELTWSIC